MERLQVTRAGAGRYCGRGGPLAALPAPLPGTGGSGLGGGIPHEAGEICHALRHSPASRAKRKQRICQPKLKRAYFSDLARS